MGRGLDRGRADAANPQRGGHWRELPLVPANVNVPQHGLDVALAQEVSMKFTKARMAAFAAGSVDTGRRCGQIAVMAKDMLRLLNQNPWTALTAKQRAALERCLKPERRAAVLQAAKAVAGVGRDAPKCLWPENLPKKPPGR